MSSGTGGSDCILENNPIVLKTCTVESINTGLSEVVPCKLHELIAMAHQSMSSYRLIAIHAGTSYCIEIMLTTRNYLPGNYCIIFNLTDIKFYGQTVVIPSPIILAGIIDNRIFNYKGNIIIKVSEPLLMGFCEFVDEGLNQVYCLTSLDMYNHSDMVTITYNVLLI